MLTKQRSTLVTWKYLFFRFCGDVISSFELFRLHL
jgi:hypothetical protein